MRKLIFTVCHTMPPTSLYYIESVKHRYVQIITASKIINISKYNLIIIEHIIVYQIFYISL